MLKYFLVFSSVIGAAAAGYCTLFPGNGGGPETSATITAAQFDTTAPTESRNAFPASDYPIRRVPTSTESGEYPIPGNEEAQMRWKTERGYATGTTRDYFDLTDGELRGLADTGHLLAMQFLAGRISVSDPERSLRLFEEAAVHGSTMALLMAAETIRFHDIHNLALGQKEGFEPGIESLKYAYVAEMRGDKVSGGVKKWHVMEHFGIDERDAERACAKAKALYQALEEQRLLLLGQRFDNSPSKSGVPSRESELNCV